MGGALGTVQGQLQFNPGPHLNHLRFHGILGIDFIRTIAFITLTCHQWEVRCTTDLVMFRSAIAVVNLSSVRQPAAPFCVPMVIDSGLRGVPREQEMLKGHLTGVIYHQALYTKTRWRTSLLLPKRTDFVELMPSGHTGIPRSLETTSRPQTTVKP